MSEDSSKKPDNSVTTPPPAPARKPADQLLIEFLKLNNMDFLIRKQKVRYMDDNGMVIEPPTIVIFYKDQMKSNPSFDVKN